MGIDINLFYEIRHFLMRLIDIRIIEERMAKQQLILKQDDKKHKLPEAQKQQVEVYTMTTEQPQFYENMKSLFKSLLPQNFDPNDEKVLHFENDDGDVLALNKEGAQTKFQLLLTGPAKKIFFVFQ